MTGSPVFVIAAFALLLFACALLLLGGRGDEKRLRDRVTGTRDVKIEGQRSPQDLLIDTPSNKTLWQKAAEILGYRPDLPTTYRGSFKIVLPLALIAGTLTFRLVQSAFPAGAAILAGTGVTLVVINILFRRKTKAYRGLLFNQIPDAMSLILRAVRAGLPVAEAIRSVGREGMSPTREEFQRVAGEAALGMPIEVTLARLYRRTDIQEYAFFSVVIGLHGQTGGNLSETLENLADMVRRRVAMAGKARALAAEGRLSSLVVGGLPFVIGILIMFVNPGYMNEFVDNPKGPMLGVLFAVLLTVGLVINNWMIQRSTQD